MHHPDIAYTAEIVSWAIAIFSSTLALFLASMRPHVGAVSPLSRRAKQRRREEQMRALRLVGRRAA